MVALRKGEPLFHMGRIVITPGAINALKKSGENGGEFLARHERGEWGIVCPDDQKRNNMALIEGERLVSSYALKSGAEMWIITEADRTVTTLLLPEEY